MAVARRGDGGASPISQTLLGITLDAPASGEFVVHMHVLSAHLDALSPHVAILGISVVFLIVILNRLVPRVAGYIMALVLGTVGAVLILRGVMKAQLDRLSRVARHLCEVTTPTSQIKDMSPVAILRLRNMTAVDATGLRAMQSLPMPSTGASRRPQPACLNGKG